MVISGMYEKVLAVSKNSLNQHGRSSKYIYNM